MPRVVIAICLGLLDSRFDTIDNVKARVWDNGGVPPDLQRLIFARSSPKIGGTLSDYSVLNESSTLGVINEDADGSRSHVSGRQKYHRGAKAPRAAGIHGQVFVACQNDGDDPISTAERDHDLKLD